jgi:transcriptional regulator with XRE-family HTH domain
MSGSKTRRKMPDPELQPLARRLVEARKAAGLTWMQVWSTHDVHPGLLRQYESGCMNPGSLQLLRFARIYKVPVSYFFQDYPEQRDAS